jgi:antitoxin (DNA-binding transcriptional repressor) of toxin-antitoxin stability system
MTLFILDHLTQTEIGRRLNMTAITIEEAQAKLPQIIEHLAPGEELAIRRGEQTVAKLVAAPAEKPTPIFGRGMGKGAIISDDEDHLKDFEEYLP